MATVTLKAYGKMPMSALAKLMNLSTGTTNLYAMLTTASHTPDQDAHQFKSDITNEVAGTGYTAGGVQCTSVTVSYDAATNKVSIFATIPAWTGATFTAVNVHFYDRSGASDSARPLVAYGTFDSPQSPSAGNLQINLTSNFVAGFTAA